MKWAGTADDFVPRGRDRLQTDLRVLTRLAARSDWPNKRSDRNKMVQELTRKQWWYVRERRDELINQNGRTATR